MNIKHTTTWPQRRWQYCTVCIFMYFCWPKWLRTSFSEVQRCLAGHDLWVKPGGFVSSVVDMSWLGIFSCFWLELLPTNDHLKKWGISFWSWKWCSHLAWKYTHYHVWRNPWISPQQKCCFSKEVILEGLGKWTHSQLCKHTSVGDAQFDVFFPSGCSWLMRLLFFDVSLFVGNNTPRCPSPKS